MKIKFPYCRGDLTIYIATLYATIIKFKVRRVVFHVFLSIYSWKQLAVSIHRVAGYIMLPCITVYWINMRMIAEREQCTNCQLT